MDYPQASPGSRWSPALPPSRWPHVILGLAGVILAIDPAIWLVGTWLDPAYDSAGYSVFAITIVLLAWSVTSPLDAARSANDQSNRQTVAIALLVLSAIVRLASQTLAINTIGALCLVADVFAIGILLRIDQRVRAISPLWLAATFSFSLPLERILQRGIGFPLQELSAAGACNVLSTIYSDLVCKGVRIVVKGVDVLVDLPCSGAGALLLGLLGYALASAFCRPHLHQAVIGFVLTLAAAVLANVLRISALAIGLAEPERFGGINVMDQPWHDIIGVCALLIVCATILSWALRTLSSQKPPSPTAAQSRPTSSSPDIPSRISDDGWWLVNHPIVSTTHQRPRRSLIASTVALGLACLIISLPRTAIDVATRTTPIALPLSISNQTRVDIPLDKRERAFFTQFGGWARKARYGSNALMLVQTTSPLRHLHTPEDCLRGQGFDVQYLGAIFEPVPTAVYRAIAPDGQRYRIDVTFISDRNTTTTNVSTAVWQWLQGQARTWTAVQRISPENMTKSEHKRFTTAVWAALDLTPTTQLVDAKGVTQP